MIIRNTHVVPNSASGEVVQMAPTSIICTRSKKSSQAKKAATAGKRKRTRDPIAAEIAEEEIKTSLAKVKRRSRRACSKKTRISSGKSTPQSLPALFTGDNDMDYAPEAEEAGSEASLEPDAEYEEAASDSGLIAHALGRAHAQKKWRAAAAHRFGKACRGCTPFPARCTPCACLQ
ncbi:hypothetical protein PCASD_02405 [Puccinia coronata f. sp. avenae]|uniref:Uncharacterized protein n=1 Tax=Puccinia coronata f. sp. avenae TaxID=200324 RepID=A0A2N5VM79_9BASI|nr:hypothetical protein PCASD_02405 [Puccinia coronata f. sp. avenae]